jgi:hypothetical protein
VIPPLKALLKLSLKVYGITIAQNLFNKVNQRQHMKLFQYLSNTASHLKSKAQSAYDTVRQRSIRQNILGLINHSVSHVPKELSPYLHLLLPKEIFMLLVGFQVVQAIDSYKALRDSTQFYLNNQENSKLYMVNQGDIPSSLTTMAQQTSDNFTQCANLKRNLSGEIYRYTLVPGTDLSDDVGLYVRIEQIPSDFITQCFLKYYQPLAQAVDNYFKQENAKMDKQLLIGVASFGGLSILIGIFALVCILKKPEATQEQQPLINNAGNSQDNQINEDITQPAQTTLAQIPKTPAEKLQDAGIDVNNLPEHLSKFKDKVQKYICPILQDIMVNPVRVESANADQLFYHYYDKQSLEEYRKTHQTCPISNCKILAVLEVPQKREKINTLVDQLIEKHKTFPQTHQLPQTNSEQHTKMYEESREVRLNLG